jgi:hypothetical protein
VVTTAVARSGVTLWGESKGARSLMRWPSPFYPFPNKFQIPPNFKIQYKSLPSSKISKLCMKLDLNILNNFPNWIDFKFPTECMIIFWNRFKFESSMNFGRGSNLVGKIW